MNVNRYRKNDIYSFKKDIIAASNVSSSPNF